MPETTKKKSPQRRRRKPSAAQAAVQEDIRSHAFWSGTITFGLVSIPVALFAGNRGRQAALRMLAPDGTPLRRRYFCPRDDRELSREEIARGYPIEKEQYVIVTDAELAALAPRKSREIDLSRFVPVAQLDPAFFDRAYFLAPTGDSLKPYRLLAATMQRSQRAGLATFVMRGKECWVAILSENGILRAETLRFADEIRPPAEAGLSESAPAPGQTVALFRDEILRLKAPGLDTAELADTYARELRGLVQAKLAAGADLLQGPAAGEEEKEEEQAEEGEAQVIDLMEVLRQSLGRSA